MMHKIYQEEPISLTLRFKKNALKLIPAIVLAPIFILLITRNKASQKYLYVIGATFTYLLFLYLRLWLKVGTYYHEVEIEAEYITFRGQEKNKAISSKFNINQVNILLHPESSKNGVYNVYLEFRAGKNSFKFNQFKNWDYGQLHSLFIDFKKAKSEKIIWDEKYILQELEKLK